MRGLRTGSRRQKPRSLDNLLRAKREERLLGMTFAELKMITKPARRKLEASSQKLLLMLHQIIRQQQRLGRKIMRPLDVSCCFGGLGLLHVLADLTHAVLLGLA